MDDLDCDACLRWIHAYLDNELDAVNAARVQAHLEHCASCRAEYATMEALRESVRRHVPYHAAPVALRTRVISQSRPRMAASIFPTASGWLAWLAPAFSTVALVIATTLYLAAPSAQDRLADDLISGHVRSLLEQHLTDVASSDRHTVKPWFTGKLDFSPPVYDFAQEGYPLLGGRLDYIGHRTVPALVYRHGRHIINLFIMPTAEADSDPHISSRRGFNLVSWRRDHLAFEAISDLNPEELEGFCRLMLGRERMREEESGATPSS